MNHPNSSFHCFQSATYLQLFTVVPHERLPSQSPRRVAPLVNAKANVTGVWPHESPRVLPTVGRYKEFFTVHRDMMGHPTRVVMAKQKKELLTTQISSRYGKKSDSDDTTTRLRVNVPENGEQAHKSQAHIKKTFFCFRWKLNTRPNRCKTTLVASTRAAWRLRRSPPRGFSWG